MSVLYKERNPIFDVAKALMMLWVIWGHLSLYNVIEPVTSVYMLNAKIGVNMPVFFVIGGFLAATTFATADWSKLIARSVLFVWPQFIFTMIYWGVIVLIGGIGAFSWTMRMWFLHTYAVIYFLSAIVFRVADTDKKRWLLFAVLYGAMLFWPSRFHVSWLGQVIHMFPYFVFGLMCLRKKSLYLDGWIACCCGALFFLFVFFQGDSRMNGMNFWTVNANWQVVFSSWHNSLTFVARSVVGITGSLFLLFLINMVIGAIPWLARLSVFGTTSLGIYVMHEYPLYVLGRHCPIVPLPTWCRWVVALLCFLLCHWIVAFLKRNYPSRVVFFGDEALLANGFRRLMRLGKMR